MATISYSTFKTKYPIGSSIGKPFPPYDYVGECVSYVLRKCVDVDGVPFNAPMGHAAQIPSNATFLKYYEEVSTPKVGDLMFWGNDAGSWTSEAGHTAIYDGSGYMMNQNFASSRVISRDKIFTAGFIGYYRKKGSKAMVTRTGLDVIYRFLLGKGPSEYGLENYLGKVTFDEAFAKVKSSTAYKSRIAAVKKAKSTTNSHLPQEMR